MLQDMNFGAARCFQCTDWDMEKMRNGNTNCPKLKSLSGDFAKSQESGTTQQER